MSQREQAVNDDLKLLGDAHRLGHMSREEYRARRRHLLIGLHDSAGATARNPLAARPEPSLIPSDQTVAPEAVTERAAASSSRSPPPSSEASASSGKRNALLAVVAVIVLVAAAVWLLRPSAPAPAPAVEKDASPLPALARPEQSAAAAADAVDSLEALADRFLDDNRWEPADIDAFLAIWRAADAVAREAATTRPGLQRLREQTAYHLKLALVLVEDAAPGKAEQAEALKQFELELRSSS